MNTNVFLSAIHALGGEWLVTEGTGGGGGEGGRGGQKYLGNRL